MASRLMMTTTHRSFCFRVELPFSSPNQHANSCIPTLIPFKSPFISRLKLRASSEGLPAELVEEEEDSKFVHLNAEDPVYGPPALLLMGFEVEEAVKIQQFLKEMDGEFLEIAKSLPRICFLSGLTGEEMMMFIDAFPESGLEPPVFAALVPNNADKPLQELIEEIMGDHEMITARRISLGVDAS